MKEPLPALLALLIIGKVGASIDKQWQAWLDTPPTKSATLAADLQARADNVTAQLLHSKQAALLSSGALGDIDLVCSGGGDLNAYYLGMHMVLSRLAAKAPKSVALKRRAGASGGGWITFELALKGETRTLESYLSYGMLQEANPISFATIATTVLLQDHHWRMMARWQAAKWNATLASLDGHVHLALACGWLSTKLKLVSVYRSPEQAASAFIATGAIWQLYEGDSCADGSSVSGDDMTPLFQDGVRPQLVVNLMDTGANTISMGFGKYTSPQFFALVQRGQDEAAEFVRTGRVARSRRAITLCPKGARVSTNVCNAW